MAPMRVFPAAMVLVAAVMLPPGIGAAPADHPASHGGPAPIVAAMTVGGFAFQVPPGWKSVPVGAGSMRKAEMETPAADGATPATVTFFHFGPGMGGNVQSNVDRWFKQFDGSLEEIGARTATETIGRTPATFVSARGTFQAGMPGGPTTPMKDYALLGAILQNPGGDVFVKMTGPQASVDAAETAFVQMIRLACESAGAPGS